MGSVLNQEESKTCLSARFALINCRPPRLAVHQTFDDCFALQRYKLTNRKTTKILQTQ